MNKFESVVSASLDAAVQGQLSSVCFTGHRSIPGAGISVLRSLLRQCIAQAYSKGARTFYCGAALGFDLLAGYEVARLQHIHPDIHLILVIPCAEQCKYWSPENRDRYENLIRLVKKRYPSDIIILSPFYFTGCMQIRNHYMVDHAQICFSYQYNLSGGTFSTVRYAQKKGIPVINLYSLAAETERYACTVSDTSFREAYSN